MSFQLASCHSVCVPVMPHHISHRHRLIRIVLLSLFLQDTSAPLKTADEIAEENLLDMTTLLALIQTRYLHLRNRVVKCGNLHLAWEYAQSPDTHHCVICLLHIAPMVFQAILTLIEDHHIFCNC